MKIEITMTNVTVITSDCGIDKVIIETDLPPTVFPFKENAHFVLHVCKGDGEKYVIDNLGIIPEVINV